jgi:hypothetical protein
MEPLQADARVKPRSELKVYKPNPDTTEKLLERSLELVGGPR